MARMQAVAPPLFVSITRRRIRITLDTISEEEDSLDMQLMEIPPSSASSNSSFSPPSSASSSSPSSSSSWCLFHVQMQKGFPSYGHDCCTNCA